MELKCFGCCWMCSVHWCEEEGKTGSAGTSIRARLVSSSSVAVGSAGTSIRARLVSSSSVAVVTVLRSNREFLFFPPTIFHPEILESSVAFG